MADTFELPVKKKRSLVLPIATAIIAVALLGYVASRAGVDKLLVKHTLDDLISQLKENARARGRDVNVTYGELEVVGNLTHKHVVVHNPVLTVKPLKPQPLGLHAPQNDSLIISTPVLEIYPQAMDLSVLRAQLPQPINFAGEDAPEKSLLKVTSNTPLALVIDQSTVNKVPHLKMHYVSPTGIDFTYLREEQAKGEEEATPTIVPVYETLHFNVAAGSGFDSDFATDADQTGVTNVHFNEIVLTPQDNAVRAIHIVQLSGEWNHQMNEKKHHVIHVNAALGPVTAAPELLPYAPISAALDATYEGTRTQTPESIASIQSPETSFDLKTFSLTTKDATLGASGNFVASAADVLPVGTATVNIVNVPFVLQQLRQYGYLQPEMEASAAAVLAQITGTPLDQTKDATVVIERSRGGSFKIGKTTFEELLATFLKQAMQPKDMGKAPAAATPGAKPAESKKPVKPITLNDNSMRG